MKTFISMLRAINVGGQKKIAVQALQRAYEQLNLANVRTYVQSGNVVFDCEEQEISILTKRIETQIEQTFGYPVPVFMRDMQDFHRIITSNPFLKGRNEDPSKLHVTFLYEPPSEVILGNLINTFADGDEFSPGEQEIYLFCPNGYGRTRLSNSFFERKLSIPATTRNWRTVNALYRMAKER